MTTVSNNTPLRWLKYPYNKPTDEAATYAVLSPNPHYIRKSAYHQHTPRYHYLLAMWQGGRFINYDFQELKVDYFIQLPKAVE